MGSPPISTSAIPSQPSRGKNHTIPARAITRASDPQEIGPFDNSMFVLLRSAIDIDAFSSNSFARILSRVRLAHKDSSPNFVASSAQVTPDDRHYLFHFSLRAA